MRRKGYPISARAVARLLEKDLDLRSWLNIVETLFGKMTRTFLRKIRVHSKNEMKERILLGIAEINAMPVVHRWKAFEALEAAGETP